MSTGEQLVVVTKQDIEELIPYLQFVKDNTSLKSEKKIAGNTITVLNNRLAGWDKSVEWKQVVLRPAQLRMIAKLKDVYNIDLSPSIRKAYWHKGK